MTKVRLLERQARFLSRLKPTKKIKCELKQVYKDLHELQSVYFTQPIMSFRSKTGKSYRKIEQRELGKPRWLNLVGIKTFKRDYLRVLPKTKISQR